MDREWLARRIEIEAWAYANADHLTRDLCYGRVLGFLEAGTARRLCTEVIERRAGKRWFPIADNS